MEKGFDQLLNGTLFVPDQGLIPFNGIPFMPDQGLIPFIGTPFMPDQGDIPPNPVIGFVPYKPLIIGRVVIPMPKGLAEPQPVLLVFPSMASDIEFIISSIMRNMAPKISALACVVAGVCTVSTATKASMSRFFFRYIINSD